MRGTYSSLPDPTLFQVSLNHFDSPHPWPLCVALRRRLYPRPPIRDYHLLIPSVPSHGSSRTIRPFSVSFSARFFAPGSHQRKRRQRSRRCAQYGGKRISGPDLVDMVFLSGISTVDTLLPYLVYVVQNLTNLVPRGVLGYLRDGATPCLGSISFLLLIVCRDIIATLI
jgi:hypothetical protein